jgi:uncharacterized RDD family membrane protein YckC
MFIILGADGKEYGPVSSGAVAEWMRDGRANLQTKVRQPPGDNWQTLSEFPEFGGKTPAAPAVPPPVKARPAAPTAEIATEAEPASRWLRLPAAMIDGLLKTLCYLPITVPLCRTMFAQAMAGEQHTFQEIAETTNQIVSDHLTQALPFFACLLAVQLTLLVTRGQTVGKLLLGLRIVRHADDAQADFLHVFLLRACVPFVFEQIPVFSLFFWLIDSAFIFRGDRRCFHDLIAGTKVVKA